MANALATSALPVYSATAALQIDGLHVFYGRSHALQGVDLALPAGVLAVVGRNGMGKTTLCNAIMGLVAVGAGRIRVFGRDMVGLPPHRIAEHGVAYVPQGRRVWPSLSVDEHLRLTARRGPDARWTVERIFATFPRLAERRRSGGSELSGGEQQMLAIGRALLRNPKLLVMDEPTEGLAPLVVQHVADMLRELARAGEMAVLLVEQNLGVATEVADDVAIMVNGAIARQMRSAALAADLELQQRLLGVGRHAHDETDEAPPPATAAVDETPHVFEIRRRGDADAPPSPVTAVYSRAAAPTRWTADNFDPMHAAGEDGAAAPAAPVAPTPPESRPFPPAPSIADMVGRRAYVVGTFDTKATELLYIKGRLDAAGLHTVTVDLATGRRPSSADIGPPEVARHHPRGAAAVFGDDRGSAVTAMAEAFERFIVTRRDIGGIIGAGGSGGTALATAGMRRLPVGLPKVMISTVASGDVGRYVGPADICMMYSVTDVQGINRISEQVLSNGAHALAGMIAYGKRPRAAAKGGKPAIGLTMFGVTTPAVQAVQHALEQRFDCLVFHATGTGGQSLEKLVDSDLLAGVIDVTTTEVADLLVGGVFPAHADRLGAFARKRLPYVGSCGALDMVNFGSMDAVPAQFRARNLYVHNPNVTLMRTTPEENRAIGRWIGERLNLMEGPVRFLLPEGGVSLLDRPGQPFHDPAADAALFDALTATVRQTAQRRLIRLPLNINEPVFAEALVAEFLEIPKA